MVLAGIAEVLFIYAFAGGVATLVHEPTTRVRTASVKASTAGMAVVAWLTVLSDTWLVYPGYRADAARRRQQLPSATERLGSVERRALTDRGRSW